jgi:hypothetical protein
MRLKRFDYTTRNQKIIDFLIGFVGWFFINIVVFGGLQLLMTAVGGAVSEALLNAGINPGTALDIVFAAGLFIQCLPLVANVAGLIYFGFTRYWIALGGLAAFGLSLLLVLCAALIFGAFCFLMLNQGTGF